MIYNWCKAHLNWAWFISHILIYITVWLSTPVPYIIAIILFEVVSLWVLYQKKRSYFWWLIPISIVFLNNNSNKEPALISPRR